MSTDKQVTAAQKVLVRTARCLPKGTSIWIQGIIVWMSAPQFENDDTGQFAIDDGSSIARVALQNYRKADSASQVEDLRKGQYVMVVGIMLKKFRGHRLGMRATTVRDLTNHGAMVETMWNLEIADAFLHACEKEKASKAEH